MVESLHLVDIVCKSLDYPCIYITITDLFTMAKGATMVTFIVFYGISVSSLS